MTGPGDTVLVRGGTYRQRIKDGSGSSGAYLTWKAYPGETPVICGSADAGAAGIKYISSARTSQPPRPRAEVSPR